LGIEPETSVVDLFCNVNSWGMSQVTCKLVKDENVVHTLHPESSVAKIVGFKTLVWLRMV
jgi:hypothetical protein